MPFLAGARLILDASGQRVDRPTADGTYGPVDVQIGAGLSASWAQNGATGIVTLTAPGASTSARVTTTDGTPTVLYSLPIPALDGFFIERFSVRCVLAPGTTNGNLAPVWLRRVAGAWNNLAGYQFAAGSDPVGSISGGDSQFGGPFSDGGKSWVAGTPDYGFALPGSCYFQISGSNFFVLVKGFATPAAWQATQPYLTSVNVSSTATSGGLIQVTTSSPHGLATGAAVQTYSVTGAQQLTSGTVTVTGGSTFTLDGSAYSYVYGGGGSVQIPNAFVQNGGNIYVLEEPGTSAGSGGPTGTSASIVDGTCHWAYVGPVSGGIPVLWVGNLWLAP